MSIETKAKELGQAIIEDPRFKRYEAAKALHDSDKELGALVERYNTVTNEFLVESDKELKDDEKLNNLSNAVRLMYEEIMKNPNMAELMASKEAIEKLLGEVNQIIDFYVTGDKQSSGCSGSGCDSCGGSCGSCGH